MCHAVAIRCNPWKPFAEVASEIRIPLDGKESGQLSFAAQYLARENAGPRTKLDDGVYLIPIKPGDHFSGQMRRAGRNRARRYRMREELSKKAECIGQERSPFKRSREMRHLQTNAKVFPC